MEKNNSGIPDEGSRSYQTKIAFGVTSAVITSLALITGLDTLTHPKSGIIGSILVIALADNLSDSMGIHIYLESEHVTAREVWLSTLSNYLSRLCISLSFIVLLVFLPIQTAVVVSVIWGLTILAVMSYAIHHKRGTNPYYEALVHLSLAVLVITVSHFAGGFLIDKFK
jgi:VIT1/CCC1 family predicted Fe2+/Mn2+ transporter